MSTPVNSLNNQIRTNILTKTETITDGTSNTISLPPQPSDLAPIRFNTPKVETAPQTETFGMHDEHEQPTGENVSFDASDPASLYSAFEKLADSPSTQDKIKAQELLLKFQELMQLQIQKASVLHDIASSAIKALRG